MRSYRIPEPADRGCGCMPSNAAHNLADVPSLPAAHHPTNAHNAKATAALNS